MRNQLRQLSPFSTGIAYIQALLESVSFKFPFFFSIASLVVEMNNIFSLIKLANTALPSSLLFYAVLRVNYRLTNDNKIIISYFLLTKYHHQMSFYLFILIINV
jgi:hypothetical protein